MSTALAIAGVTAVLRDRLQTLMAGRLGGPEKE